MPRRKPPEEPQGMDHNDPRRPLKVRRLQAERDRIAGFVARDPSLDDQEFEEWEQAVHSLLVELFGANEFVLRFKQITFRPIRYCIGGGREWYADPAQVWKTGLSHADKVLREALEEGEVVVPYPAAAEARGGGPSIHVTVHNQNVFSPNVQVSVQQLLAQLDTMSLSVAERAEAKEHIGELAAETKGAKRWPIIARSLEAIKALGKSVYKDIAVPLIVEFLKQEAGLKPGGTQ